MGDAATGNRAVVMKVTDSIRGAPRGTYAEAIAALDGADAKDEVFVRAVFALAPDVGIDPAIAIAQVYHETGRLSSPRWNNNLNPSGLGIPSDDTPQPFVIPNAEVAAAVHLHALYALVTGFAAPWSLPPDVDRWIKTVWAGHILNSPPVRTIADLNIRYPNRQTGPSATWAWDPAYGAKVAAMGNAVFPSLPDQGTTPQPQPEPTPMPDSKPTILLVAGHRNTTGGNPEEVALTPALCRSYKAALSAAGYRVEWLQEIDGDLDPDDTSGSLDLVGRKCHEWAQRQPGDNHLVMLDCHYEGGGVRGVFAIVPDGTGLRTAVTLPQLGSDNWAGNLLDRQLGKAIASRIAERTGLPLRASGVKEPGLMSERQTGVGGQGFRLGMFAYTSPDQERMVRLVVEHGAHDIAADRAIIFREDFTDRCAQAMVAAFADVFGATAPGPPTVPPPIPTPPPTVPPPAVETFGIDGFDADLARMRFGRVEFEGTVYEFNPIGPLSTLWLERARQTGIFAGLARIRRFGTRRYFEFADGWTCWSPNDQAPVRVQKG